TEGAFLVSAKRAGGRTVWIRIKSLAGEPCRIQTDLISPTVQGTRDHALVALSSDRYELDILQGESIVLSGEATGSQTSSEWSQLCSLSRQLAAP
ncbi:MAG: hypothetical protein HN919_15110, partial [Verrucomicrobia bacterium]|nr:hypothetical protein [Verrucomicrobiota bacterium]